MSGDSSDENDFNYDNCIPRCSRDSDDSSSEFSLHLDTSSKISNAKEKPVQDNEGKEISNDKAKPVQVDQNNEPSPDFSVSQLEDFEFNPGDAYVFLLGMVNRIHNYLKKQDKGNEWLQKQIEITKAVLIKNSHLFQVIQVEDNNGTLYVKKCNLSKKEFEKGTDAEKPVISEDVSEPPVQSEVDTLEQEPMVSESPKNNVTSGHKQSKPSSSSKPTHVNLKHSNDILKLNPRHSQRLQNTPQDKKFVCTDRLSNIALKLGQYRTSTPKKGASSKSKRKSQDLIRNVFSKSVEMKIQKTKQSEISTVGLESVKESEENMQNNHEKSTLQKTISLGANQTNNVDCPSASGAVSKKQNDKKVQLNKRRAVSMGGRDQRVNKKAKLNETNPSETSETSSLSNSAKRKLYSEDTWLPTFTSFMINTPPST